jgi:glutathione S-transferase
MPLTLYSYATPNGVAASIILEELKAIGSLPGGYEVVKMSPRDADIGKVHNQVKAPWFLEINPNGRIPAITHDGFNVFETSAILVESVPCKDRHSISSIWSQKRCKYCHLCIFTVIYES